MEYKILNLLRVRIELGTLVHAKCRLSEYDVMCEYDDILHRSRDPISFSESSNGLNTAWFDFA